MPHGAAYVFAPSAAEMYPRARSRRPSRVGDLAARWEGESRPGHFDGVATVVAKLFAQAGPCRAYFGEKDYQQLCVIRRLVADLDLPVEVVGCPTVREPDGLALSSRNAYLTPDDSAVPRRRCTGRCSPAPRPCSRGRRRRRRPGHGRTSSPRSRR